AIDPREVARARALVRDTLRDWGLAEMAETAQQLVGEVVTNAVRHAHTRAVGLRLVRADALLCEVSDDDHAVPVLLSAGPDDEGGRGMRIVSRLAREWGTSRSSHGKTVWFEQPLPRRGR
ncbi:MAG TPA: ATP-binding protein, partial [Streptomyces sp.]